MRHYHVDSVSFIWKNKVVFFLKTEKVKEHTYRDHSKFYHPTWKRFLKVFLLVQLKEFSKWHSGIQ